MTKAFDTFIHDIEATFFLYAHLSGAWEMYMVILNHPGLQKAYSQILTGEEIEWKQIHRYMVIDNKVEIWYPELPINQITENQLVVAGQLYGIIISSMVSNIDYYLSTILMENYGKGTRGSAWNSFIAETGIDLHSLPKGDLVFTLIQERHKIQHSKAKIDKRFIDEMQKKNIEHAYTVGGSIEKSHLDVLAAKEAIVDLIKIVDEEIEQKVIAAANTGST